MWGQMDHTEMLDASSACKERGTCRRGFPLRSGNTVPVWDAPSGRLVTEASVCAELCRSWEVGEEMKATMGTGEAAGGCFEVQERSSGPGSGERGSTSGVSGVTLGAPGCPAWICEPRARSVNSPLASERGQPEEQMSPEENGAPFSSSDKRPSRQSRDNQRSL